MHGCADRGLANDQRLHCHDPLRRLCRQWARACVREAHLMKDRVVRGVDLVAPVAVAEHEESALAAAQKLSSNKAAENLTTFNETAQEIACGKNKPT